MRKTIPLLILFILPLLSCSLLKPETPQTETVTPPKTSATPPPATTAPSPTAPAAACLSQFEPHDLQSAAQSSRQTLSEDAWNDTLSLMGIESLCIPPELGAPFINVDWQPGEGPAMQGRMLSIGFENLYTGSGWSDGHLLYATYDFKAGTEYDTYATPEDRDRLRQGEMDDMVEINGTQGFVRTVPASLCMGSCAVYKTTVFPFEEHYIALVYEVGVIQPEEDWDAALEKLQVGNYAPERQIWADVMDQLAASIRYSAP